MYKKHTEAEWAKVLELHLSHVDSPSISKQTGIELSEIKRRIQQFRLTGDWRTNRKPNVQATAKLKRQTIDAVIQQSLSCCEATVKYGISFSTIKSWLRKFRHGGYEELLATKPKGRPPKMPKKKKSAKGMTELERLRERVEYLEAENAYLKKLKALDQEENAEMFGIGPRQSED